MQFGANGCGESTFMKILGGELEPGALALTGVKCRYTVYSRLDTSRQP